MKKLIIGFLSLAGTFAVAAPAYADFTIRSPLTGKCLGVSGGSGTAGTSVVTYTCDGTLNQRWAAGNYWPSPDNMFTHLLNRVNGAASTNRCLGLSTTLGGINASCNNSTSDPDEKGWWVDFAGMYSVPGLAGQQYCYSIKSKLNPSLVLTTTTGENNVQPTLNLVSGSLTNGQVWCVVNI